jgi:hypothetical protein
MVLYICPTCNRQFKKKYNFEMHTKKKKFPCQKPPEILFNNNNNNNNIEILHINEEKTNENNKNLSCEFCKIVFNRRDNLNRHLKDRCKLKKLHDEEKIFKILLAKEEIKTLKQSNEELQKKYTELQVNDNNLQKKYTELQVDNKNLQKKYTELQVDNKNLQKNNKKTEKNYDELKKNYEELEKNNKIFIKRNKKLEDTINEYSITINNNNKQISELKNINTINNNLIKYEELTNESDNENESNNLVINNNIIMSRETDKYINAIQLCKAGNKKFNDWIELDNTKQLISVLEKEAGIHSSQLIDIKKGRTCNREQGIWIHPDLAIQLAQWINPHFTLQVSSWIRTLFSKGKVNFKLIKKQEEKINRSTKKIKELETMVLKKQKREIYTDSNVIYMLTTQDHKKRNTYIIGKAINLTDRLSTYNKTCDHEVIYFKSCENEENMNWK